MQESWVRPLTASADYYGHQPVSLTEVCSNASFIYSFISFQIWEGTKNGVETVLWCVAGKQLLLRACLCALAESSAWILKFRTNSSSHGLAACWTGVLSLHQSRAPGSQQQSQNSSTEPPMGRGRQRKTARGQGAETPMLAGVCPAFYFPVALRCQSTEWRRPIQGGPSLLLNLNWRFPHRHA